MARKPADEQEGLSLADIEDGGPKRTCYACQKPQIILVLIHETGLGFRVKTKNKVGACTNTKCFRFLDLKQVKTWIPEDTVIPNEQPLGASQARNFA